MMKLMNVGWRIGVWARIAGFVLAAVVVGLLIRQGLHPAWGVLLFLYRKAAFRVCIFLGLLYWLTHGILS
jgi:hypothetical protein